MELSTLRHSCSHILASSVLRLYPGTKLAIGPSIDEGFYYDFDPSTSSGQASFSESDLEKISLAMQDIIKENLSFEKKEISLDEAKKFFSEEPYKLELIEDLEKEGNTTVTTYKTGEFTDLCAGPHIENTKEITAFKLLSVAGAYWRGTEKNKMLTRIYGTCFPTQKELDDYLNMLEEVKKRDHRVIGKELELFSIDDKVGPGLILWHPKLSVVREEIELYWRKEHRKRGYQYVYTPNIGMSTLWETSGHLGFFKEGMFPPMDLQSKNKDEKASYYVKPMNCPFHIQIYKTRPRSYRELPLRWCELGSVYRYEESGVLHGMLRVRGFTQDDAHIICREDQFVEEVNAILDFALEINRVFGFEKLKVYLSTRDLENKTKYVGEEKNWVLAEETLKEILEERKIEYKEDVGGAKFYGPAIDLKAVDALGREWQGTTIQLDFNEPERFKMTYVGDDGQEHTPIMLHRTLLGSMERFVATLIEQHKGAFPTWLAPVQAIILPITDNQIEYAQKVAEELKNNDIRTEVETENKPISGKIRDAEMQKIPYMLIVGGREAEAENLSVRLRGEKDLGLMSLTDFTTKIKEEIEKKL
jgi:threonyl-tRNA synthetase